MMQREELKNVKCLLSIVKMLLGNLKNNKSTRSETLKILGNIEKETSDIKDILDSSFSSQYCVY